MLPPSDFSPCLCGPAGDLSLAVELEICKEIEFENEKG